MTGKGKKVLLTLLEIFLCLMVAWWLVVAWTNFSLANHLRESKPWLVSETEPTAAGAMTTLEEEQGKLRLVGGLCILFALPPLGAEIGLRLYRRKQRRNTDEHQTSDNP